MNRIQLVLKAFTFVYNIFSPFFFFNFHWMLYLCLEEMYKWRFWFWSAEIKQQMCCEKKKKKTQMAASFQYCDCVWQWKRVYDYWYLWCLGYFGSSWPSDSTGQIWRKCEIVDRCRCMFFNLTTFLSKRCHRYKISILRNTNQLRSSELLSSLRRNIATVQ